MPATPDGQCRARCARPGPSAVEYERKWDKYERDGGETPDARPRAWTRCAACSTARSSSTTIATAPTRWPIIMDMAKEFGYRVTAFHHAVESLQDRRPAARRTASARRCGPTGGASRWKPMTRINENIPLVHNAGACAIVHSDDANGIQRLNQEAAKALADGRRMGIHIPDEVAWTWLSYQSRPRRSASPTGPAACKRRQDGRRGAVERQSVQRLHAARAGLDRRRPALRHERSAAGARSATSSSASPAKET